MKLVIFPPVTSERLARIEAAAGAMTVVNAPDVETALGALADADAFYGKLTPPLLAGARRLAWVQSPTASLEHYVFPELVEHACQLTNMRGLYSDVIADQVLGYMLCFARNLHLYIRQQIEHRWAPIGATRVTPDYGRGQSGVRAMDRAHLHLSDCTLGVVGLGAIGAEIARRALAFNMRVVAVDPAASSVPHGVSWVRPPAELDTLLKDSDFVAVAAPHTPLTQGWFGAEQFAAMRRGAYFINIGRGAIVRLEALVDALRSGHLAGAALDVFETEPLPANHPLWAMANVIITPHVAAASVHVAGRHEDVLCENIERFVKGEPLNNLADKAAWY